jgi:hypothetical protein
MTIKALEQQAIRAHACGTRWADWWPTVAADVAQAEPHDRHRFHRLRQHLLGLVISGDTDGQEPVAATRGQPEPWEIDDQAQDVPVLVTSDTEIAARCLGQEEDVDLPRGEARSGRLARLLGELPGWSGQRICSPSADPGIAVVLGRPTRKCYRTC